MNPLWLSSASYQDIDIDSYLNLTSPINLTQTILNSTSTHTPLSTDHHHEQILPCIEKSSMKGNSKTLESETNSVVSKKMSRDATAKYRQKRKKYIMQLEDEVKKLQMSINGVENDIKECKDSILVKLEQSTKDIKISQNSQIYSQLQSCVQRGEADDLIDVDQINLLLNTLKYRIGATGRERQSKIEYNFKNIINTLLPGLHRYILITVTDKKDIFRASDQSFLTWTSQFLKHLNLSEQQRQKVNQYEQKLLQLYCGTKNKIISLQNLKNKMKQSAFDVDTIVEQIRQDMNPVQCARWTIFGEKYKYRKSISLDDKFRTPGVDYKIEDEMQELLEYRMGRKRVHRDF